MFYIFGIIILFGIFLYVNSRAKGNETIQAASESKNEFRQVASDCCGAHANCEFDDSVFKEKVIVYFDDEELDELRNIREIDLTSAQIDELREVLYTLRTGEISKWLISLAQRHIHLPSILQQEARQLMAEK
jgi:hypothetical protein